MKANKLHIIADDKIPFLKGVLEPYANIRYLKGSDINSHDVKDADALIVRTRTKCDKTLLSGSAVKFIATATIGFDHIDTDYCRKNNIKWTNAPGCNSSSVEQYITSVLLNMAADNLINPENSTIGIVGVGNVGSKIVRIAKALGMNVLLNDPPRKRKEKDDSFVDLEKIQKEADIISFHTPLNKEGIDKTFHLVNELFFRNLKKTPWVFNTSRGAVVEQKALLAAIKSKLVRGAVLDVWESEPELNTETLSLVQYASPHIAGYSTDGKANGTSMSVNALFKFFGIEAEEWYPVNIPMAGTKNIILDCHSMNKWEILRQVYNQTYNILIDHNELISKPSSFENLRGNYRIRREPQNYTVKLINNPYDEIDTILRKLNFQVLEQDCFC